MKLSELHVIFNLIKVVFIGPLIVYFKNVTGLRDVFGYFKFVGNFTFFFPAVSMIYLLAQR